MLCLMLEMSDFPAIFATNDRWLTTKLYDNERVVLWMTSLVFRSKRVSRNADLNFEITRRGSIICSRPCAQGGFFYAVNIWRKRKNPYLCDNNESRQHCLRKLKGIQPPILNTFCF